MGESKKKRLKTFPHIEARDFQHPWDAKATEALKSVPGLDKVVSKVMEYGLERVFIWRTRLQMFASRDEPDSIFPGNFVSLPCLAKIICEDNKILQFPNEVLQYDAAMSALPKRNKLGRQSVEAVLFRTLPDD